MMSILARFAAASIGAFAVAEGYYVYLQQTLTPPSAESVLTSLDRRAADLESAMKASAPDSLAEWFHARAEAAGISSEIRSTDKEIIVSFTIPGLQADSVKVLVDNVRVLITCVANMPAEGGAPAGAARREGLRQYELIMPLPDRADSARHRVVSDKNTFQIIFSKLDDPLLKY